MMRFIGVAFLTLLSGCSYLPALPLLGEAEEELVPTLADLQPVRTEPGEERLPPASLEALQDAYRSVLGASNDPSLQLNVRRRLADLALMQSEALSLGGQGTGADYREAIAAYRSLLTQYPDIEGTDQLLYQMARAHDLSGKGDEAVALMIQLSDQHAHSPHALEALFRKGDAYFSAGDYGAAAVAYQQVANAGQDSEYYANSLYMLAWSHFKQSDYDAAVNAYVATLDALLIASYEVTDLARGDRDMAQDSLRVMAIIFDSRGGSKAIAPMLSNAEAGHYRPLAYDALGSLYLEQERFEDSAQAYAGFIADEPFSEQAPGFQEKLIAVYEAAGFPQQVIAAKTEFVSAYAVDEAYWESAGSGVRALIRPRLAQYIDELARYHHSLAQQGHEAGEESVAHYLRAADYYAMYVDSFPRDDRVPDMLFLLAEALREAGKNGRAIIAFEQMAYGYPEHPQAADAGYASLAIAAEDASARSADTSSSVDSQLRFASVFNDDARASAVMASAAGALFDAGRYESAVAVSREIVSRSPLPSVNLLLTAWLTAGHAEFELGRYAVAEQDYRKALALLAEQGDRRDATLENLAATIYRQAELAAADGDHLMAAEHFSRVTRDAPLSAVSVTAQYDAAGQYFLAGDAERGIETLVDFRRRYPANALSRGIAARLVEQYEQQEAWQQAASELDRMVAADSDPAIQREALYLAATYYRRAGETELAIERFKRYAHTWKSPLAPAMESMLALAELYEQPPQPAKRQYWLAKMAGAYEASTESGNARARYLAAQAASELADGYYDAYLQVALTEPLPQSLKQKREAMDRAVMGYERVNNLGVADFGTRATFRLGEIYRHLSGALMASPRPRNLDALALEQYEILLEEQAWPFEEKASAIFLTNIQRAREGLFDSWIEQSFVAMSELMPARWGRQEKALTVAREIR